MFNVLALCTGNSSRSILAEAILNRDGAGRVRGYSAGSNPSGLIHHTTLKLLRARGIPAAGMRSKSWREFQTHGAPPLDLILVLCPAVAGEIGPDWPGAPLIAFWEMSDPAAAPADQIDLAHSECYHRLSARINALLALPFERMTPEALDAELERIAGR